MVDVNKIIDIEDLYGKKRIDETFNVINYNEIRQYSNTKQDVSSLKYCINLIWQISYEEIDGKGKIFHPEKGMEIIST